MQVNSHTRVRTEWGPRQRSIARARQSFNPTTSRSGRLMVQARRGLIANGGLATTSQLLAWAYPHDRKHWHCMSCGALCVSWVSRKSADLVAADDQSSGQSRE